MKYAWPGFYYKTVSSFIQNFTAFTHSNTNYKGMQMGQFFADVEVKHGMRYKVIQN
jgi:hypothetical protein